MKNLNTRTKMLLAIAGVVIVVVIAGILFMGPGSDLFGTAIINISPENPTIHHNSSIQLNINSVYNCTWTTSNVAIASLYDYDPNIWPPAIHASVQHDTKYVLVYGTGIGQVTITARCPFHTKSTTVTVVW